VVIGGGHVAARKVKLLLASGAQVRVIAPELCDELSEHLRKRNIEHHARPYAAGDVGDAVLVIAATNDVAVNRAVSHEARSLRVPVNVVDNAELSSVILPSIVDRSPVLVAISSSGQAPTLSRLLRARLEAWLPKQIGAVARFVGQKRAELKGQGRRFSRQQWEALVSAAPEALESTFAALSDESRREQVKGTPNGWVAIVGAGPGDPELITLRALQLLQQADVVMYDNLVNRAILDYARRDADQVYVGKKRALASTRQEDIHDRLLLEARAGRNVVRLKGGDPFIFGRGGEEITSLADEGIECIVVPGITAALGAASYAGIPLTWRNLSQSVRFVTGHRARGSIDIDWVDFAKPAQTLVFYMGLFNLPEICEHLMAHGLAGSTPAALIENATLPSQRVIEGTVETLAAMAQAQGVSGPSTVIVGEVVRFRQQLKGSSWDAAGPLSGQ
jgi:uroporphyrin-III C-methyltransferase/precorrin-2 dehydrogenase/sirohydrochlorin ferrochelatase